MKKTLRILGYCLIAILGLLLAVQLFLMVGLSPLISNVMTDQLNTETRIEGLKLKLLRGKVALRRLTIAQPKGYATQHAAPLFQMDGLHIAAGAVAGKTNHFEISDFQIAGLSLHIIRNADGILNIQKLGSERTSAEPQQEEPEPQAKQQDNRFTFTLKQFQLPTAVIAFSDLRATPPVHIAITNLQVDLSEVQFDTAASASSTNVPGRIRVTGTILQQGLPDGFLGLDAALGIVSTNIPAVNAAIRIVGFDLRSLDGILPSGIATAIGGNNLDVVVNASIANDYLNVESRVATSGNVLRLNIGGTPAKPDIDKTSALFNLVTRPGAFLAGTVTDVADAGIAAGKTVVSSAGKAGSGILSGVANIGRGAARAAQSAVRGDIQGVGEGVVDMTYGTMTSAVETVSSTAREVGVGFGETVAAASGGTSSSGWEKGNAVRWNTAWTDAQQFVTSAPFPTAPRE